jgi:hypothetical protein
MITLKNLTSNEFADVTVIHFKATTCFIPKSRRNNEAYKVVKKQFKVKNKRRGKKKERTKLSESLGEQKGAIGLFSA